jgi:phage terminase Nu1 subunit (DNA packaging protein)
MLVKAAAVPLDVAAELVDVDVETIRRWAEQGSVEIDTRGGMEVVRLDRIRWLAGAGRGDAPGR